MVETRRIRYAVVGLGNIAQVAVLPAFAHAENAELVALVSSDGKKRRELSARYGVEHTGSYEDFEQVLEGSQADAVYIALPNHLHREYTERAAACGVHVLCEKPMATSSVDCQAMIDATRYAGVRLMIAYRLHFEAANLRAIEHVRSGQIGNPVLLETTLTHWVEPGNIRTRPEVGGGALLDIGVYCINAARYLFGDEPEEVFCFANFGREAGQEGVDETVAGVLRFPGGRHSTFQISQVASSVSHFRLVGSQGVLEVEGAFSFTDPRTLILTRDDEREEEVFPKSDQFAPVIVYFSRCLLEEREPEPSGIEGLADVRIIEALQRSATLGEPVAVEPFPEPCYPSPDQRIDKPAVEPPPTVNA
jgi:predicted dehydrogenase